VVLLAAEKGLSIGQLISQMVKAETSLSGKNNAGNGSRIGSIPSARSREVVLSS
jgi:hypothetical protein